MKSIPALRGRKLLCYNYFMVKVNTFYEFSESFADSRDDDRNHEINHDHRSNIMSNTYSQEERDLIANEVAGKAKSSVVKKIPLEIIKLAGKSAKIRALDAKGWTKNEIRASLSELYGKEIRFQHVRNVLVTKLTSK